MANEHEKLNELLLKLEQLQKKQNEQSAALFELRKEISRLKFNLGKETTKATPEIKVEEPPQPNVEKTIEVQAADPVQEEPVFTETNKQSSTAIPQRPAASSTSNLEKFIGENLISKIGILITIIGVAIGTKYTIEHNLIGELTRIILGYGAGIVLLLFGMKLKKNYEKYSAVLVSGAMSIMYFVTYAAHSIYHFIPQSMGFLLMVVFTIFTVVAALNYKQVIIAQLGLVGAYAVPFLLSNGSGRAEVLFTYVAIINMGILFISFKKYWRSLYYSSFIITWLIFLSWFLWNYDTAKYFGIAFTFITITFLTFYATYLAYKIIQKKSFEIKDVVLILMNTGIYFGLGYYLLSMHPVGKNLLGLFALLNALMHFVVSVVVYRQKLADKNLFYLIGGLVLVFLTIAIPIQLDGNWVTLLWAGEAALLCWIGRAKEIRMYEYLSYPVMGLAFISILQDWSQVYGRSYFSSDMGFAPLLNVNFLSSALFMAAFSFIVYCLFKKGEQTIIETKGMGVIDVMKLVIPSILLLVTFLSFALELSEYWNMKIWSLEKQYDLRRDYRSFKYIWLVNYTLLFITGLFALNQFKIKSARFGKVNIALSIVGIFLFLTIGLYEYSELRESYIAHADTSSFYLVVRYVSFAFAAVLLWFSRNYIQQIAKGDSIKQFFNLFLHFILIWVLSSELLQWLDLGNTDKNYKLGLSILWGIYSLLLIVLGIWKNKQYLRIGAMVLFGVTLIKLFIYDLMHLDTISKTIVFVSLGALLLIISFLYNKYSSIINYEKEQ